ncbi:hypothetical protein [Aneurinibacillus terranovensis]|uniref:hypothetical protein n=1 Tax=Aneurinibacillus terranovensis TaxID=278991 RepID=UPI0004043171|nr:hypothetical protein [Aneurinibacillus terranovensis]
MNRTKATWIFLAGVVLLTVLVWKELGLSEMFGLQVKDLLQAKYLYTFLFSSFLAIGVGVVFYIIRKM